MEHVTEAIKQAEHDLVETREQLRMARELVLGLEQDAKRIEIEPPIVIRLTGTNEELALEILEEAGFSAYTSMDAVVEKAVARYLEAYELLTGQPLELG